MASMNHTLRTVVVLALALLAMGQIAQAQGPPADAGPPDHASNEDPEPHEAPDHVDEGPKGADKAPNQPTDKDGTTEEETSTVEQTDKASQEDATTSQEPQTDAISTPDPTETQEASDEPIETTSTAQREQTDPTLPPTDQDKASQDPTAAATPQPAAEALPEGPTPLQDTFHQRTDATTLPKTTLTQAFTPANEGTSRTQGASTPTAPSADAGWIFPGLFMLGLGALATVTLRSPKPSDPATANEEDPKAEEATMFQPQPGLEGLLMLGKNALDQGDNKAAIGWFETAIALKPNLQAAHFCLGLCLDDAGHLDQAQDALDNAHELEPNDPLARYALASIHARQGATGQALHHVHHVAQALPTLAETMLEDDEFTSLHDHPRFLALLGRL